MIDDMNELLHAAEKEGGVVRRESQMQPFWDVLAECDVINLGFTGSPFTWKGPGMRSRLDRAVAMATWSDIFTAVQVRHLAPTHGDHIPIVLGVFQVPPSRVVRQRYRFRFGS